MYATVSAPPDQNRTTLTFLVLTFVVVPAFVIAIVALRPPLYLALCAGIAGIATQMRILAWYRDAASQWDDNEKKDDENSSDWWK